jgi:broad specificity phosphatase PhoE
MRISLIRHGRPAIDYHTRISGVALDSWLHAYERAGMDVSLQPPAALKEALVDCSVIITSGARRAIDSADLLRLSARRLQLDVAHEAPLPRCVVFPVKLKPLTLTVIARSLWLFKLVAASESRAESIARARRFALVLEGYAEESEHVAVVGHGYFHRFTAAALRRAGWSTVRSGHGYWSLSQFQKKAPNKAPEPTPTAVTPRAMEDKSQLKQWICNRDEARGAPAAVVAHL